MGDGTAANDCYQTVDGYFDPIEQELKNQTYNIWFTVVKDRRNQKKYHGNKYDGKGYHDDERDGHKDIETIEEYLKASSKGPAKGQVIKGVVDHRAGLSMIRW